MAVVLLAGLRTGETAAQITVAHWSFDFQSVALDVNGIFVVSDLTGAHPATRTSPASGALPINVVPGPFGDAAEFTNTIGEDAFGASRLQIPNLFEIMGPMAGGFTVAAWVNTTAVGQDNTILSDWVSTHSYWFQLDNASSVDARPRAQIRNPSGGDIIAATITDAEAGQANLADGLWHHYAWTWNKGTATMTWYIDGVQRAVRTSAQTGSNLDLRVSSNANAHIGWKQDSNDHFSGELDELWVFDAALTPQQVESLKLTNVPFAQPEITTLTLRVDPFNGLIVLKNTTDEPVTISSYRITSASGALNRAGWNPLSDGNEYQDEFPRGFGNGEGWEIAPNASNFELEEWYLTGGSTLLPGQAFNLGHGFNPAGAHNVQFEYALSDNTLKTGAVFYFGIPVQPPDGDYNDNGVVDAADYVAWRKNVGTTNVLPNDPVGNEIGMEQYNVWRANFGRPALTFDPLGSGAAVPEPAAMGLLIVGALISGWLGSRLRRAPSMPHDWGPARLRRHRGALSTPATHRANA